MSFPRGSHRSCSKCNAPFRKRPMNIRRSNSNGRPMHFTGISSALAMSSVKHLAMLEEREVEVEREIERVEARGQKVLAAVDVRIAELRRWLRSTDANESGRSAVTDQINQLEQKQRDAERWLRSQAMLIRDGHDDFEADVLKSLTNHGEVAHLYTVRWTAIHSRDRREPVPRFKVRMQHSCSNGSPVSVTMSISPYCTEIFRRSVGTASPTGRASSTGAFSNGRLLPPEFR